MSAYSAAVLADSPQFYWRLGEASGTAIADSSGNGLGATLSASMPPGGVASLLAGDTADGAIAFDRTGALGPLSADGAAGTNNDAGPLSVEFWANFIDLTTSNAKSFVVSNNLGSGQGWAINYNGTGWEWTSMGVDGRTFSEVPVPGVTKHMVFTTPDLQTITLYVNGALSQTVGPMGAPTSTGGSFATLNYQRGGSNYGRIKLDEVAVYRSVLSAGRIAAHYAAAAAAVAFAPRRSAMRRA